MTQEQKQQAHNARMRRWRKANSHKVRKINHRYRFGISKKQYQSLLNKQNNRCAICNRKSKRRALAVDHCHRHKLVRGLLCTACNVALGLLRDDLKSLKRAIRYLQKPLTPS